MHPNSLKRVKMNSSQLKKRLLFVLQVLEGGSRETPYERWRDKADEAIEIVEDILNNYGPLEGL